MKEGYSRRVESNAPPRETMADYRRFEPPPEFPADALIKTRLPVWPWYALALVAGAVGVVLMVTAGPAERYPTLKDLTMISGNIEAVQIRDWISGSQGGASLAAATSVFFRLEGVDDEVFYPSVQPDYFEVRDRTSVAIDVWVETAAMGSGEPLRIWQIRERNPYNLIGVETSIPLERIVAQLRKVEQASIAWGRWLFILAAVFLAIALVIHLRVNRSRAPPVM